MATFFSWIARLVLQLVGWRIEGTVPPYKKMIFVGAYHTSNLDGFLLVAAAFALRHRVLWMVKHTIMKFPLSLLLRALGALPINRASSHGVVEQVVDEFNRRETMKLVIAPEGTRRKVSRWKRGFYVIAQQAGVPIVLAAPDYKRRAVVIGPAMFVTGDVEADLAIIRNFFSDKTPRFPEQAGEITFGTVRQGDGKRGDASDDA